MTTLLLLERSELIKNLHYRPAISIVMPFEPKMMDESVLVLSVETTVRKAEQKVLENYSLQEAERVIQKLQSITSHLDYNTHKKSIAIYVSPVFEKMLYLDIEVEERVEIDDGCGIRNLVSCKKKESRYLLLQLGEKESQVYFGCTGILMRIVSSTPASLNAYVREMQVSKAVFPEKPVTPRADVNMFLRYIDNSLGILLSAHRLPLFVMGSTAMLEHFQDTTRYKRAVTAYVQGNDENNTAEELKVAMMPYINDWEKVRRKFLLSQLEDAVDNNKLASGIYDVWRDTIRGKGRLLAVEKDYRYAVKEKAGSHMTPAAYMELPYTLDAVDDIMERVLATGGDIEFVDNGALETYRHIALIK